MSAAFCVLQVKQDLRMLALRGVFDPKRFYRAPDATKFPKYFQMGTVVAGPTDFYSGEWCQLDHPDFPASWARKWPSCEHDSVPR